MTTEVISLAIEPGIQRDGTLFDSPRYVDGQWCRFQRGRPRKIGGYRAIFLNATGISRGMAQNSANSLNYMYSGFSSGIEAWQIDNDDGTGSGPTEITLSGFTTNANNLWQFDFVYDAYGTGQLTILAHPGQNLSDIDSTTNTPVLFGLFPYGNMSQVGVFTATGTISSTTFTITGVNALIAAGQLVTGTGVAANTKVTAAVIAGGNTTVTLSIAATSSGSQTFTFNNQISVSGGVVCLYPYTFVYGNNGLIQNNSANNLQDWVAADSNANNVCATKVVKGLPVRGGSASPAGLFWSLDSVIRVTYNPTTVGTSTIYWSYDTISSQSSILSSSCVIEYDGIFYWIGVDRFLMYNGVVQELPNVINFNYFFNNLNYTQRQKVWASKVPRWGEIWWFFPSGNSTECNDAIIYNVREKTWYDAGQALGARRSAGTYSEVYHYPIWAGWETNAIAGISLWQHETGTNQISLSNVDAVLSYFETNSLGWVSGGPESKAIQGTNRWIRIERVEPDFVQLEQMSVTVTGKGYADDVDVTSDPYYFDPTTLKVDMREQRREMRLRFTSNIVNGAYEMGNVLLSADFGDERSTGNP